MNKYAMFTGSFFVAFLWHIYKNLKKISSKSLTKTFFHKNIFWN